VRRKGWWIEVKFQKSLRRAITVVSTAFGLILMNVGMAYAITVPDPEPAVPPGLEGPAETVVSWLKWVILMACVIGISIGLIQMAVGRRNRHALAVDGASGIPWALGAGVGAGVMAGLLEAIF
jgi:hypothetical protein